MYKYHIGMHDPSNRDCVSHVHTRILIVLTVGLAGLTTLCFVVDITKNWRRTGYRRFVLLVAA